MERAGPERQLMLGVVAFLTTLAALWFVFRIDENFWLQISGFALASYAAVFGTGSVVGVIFQPRSAVLTPLLIGASIASLMIWFFALLGTMGYAIAWLPLVALVPCCHAAGYAAAQRLKIKYCQASPISR